MKKLIECVPNFSEGGNMAVIKQITDEIEKVEGVKLIDVDPGKATNRTVVTFVGEPEPVIEAAFKAITKASQLIDMSKHKGAHPRFGATDVCPLVPVANITMEEVVKYAHKLAERVGRELNIPVYCYEFAAKEEKRRNLASCRSGEYEGLEKKLTQLGWQPDFGPNNWDNHVAHTGATAIGARNFLIAYNINLNTTSTRRANAVAFDIREKGRTKREGNPVTGKIIKDEAGNPVFEPGLLKSVKAIGWYIEEYGTAQISINLTNLDVTPLHKCFDVACERATVRGLRVTGSELVGVVPLKAMLDAGKYFLNKQNRSVGINESAIIDIAVKSLGLNELYPFEPDKKIIEYILKDTKPRLVDTTLVQFANNAASESPAPGGGSVSAYVGALGASLASMVANLSAHKRGWDERWEEFSNWAEKGMSIKQELIRLVDEDTKAFNRIMEAFALPKASETEKAIRKQAIDDATLHAINIPFKVMQEAYNAFDVAEAMVKEGNPNSVSDAGVGTLCIKTAIEGAYLNVKINAQGLKDNPDVSKILIRADELSHLGCERKKTILALIEEMIKH